MKSGIYTETEEIVHNDCPHCGADNEVDEAPAVCERCKKKFEPSWRLTDSIATAKARKRLASRFQVGRK